MRYLALACDYDGTLASQGHVSKETLAALERLIRSGRKLIMVTGRELADLFSVFTHYHIFDWIVAENGCVLYCPENRKTKWLAEPPPPKLIHALREREVPISIGGAMISTSHPYEKIVLDTIRELGLEFQVVFNKGAVMILPSGINKATGLAAALKRMKLSPRHVVGVGDAENDHAFLKLCQFSVAVANALSTLKDEVDFVTAEENGAGVRSLVEEIIATDLTGTGGGFVSGHFGGRTCSGA